MTTRAEQRRIDLKGVATPYRLHRVPRRKRLTLMVEPDGTLVVRVPHRVPVTQVESFIREHALWIMNHQVRAEQVRFELGDGALLSYLGEELRLAVEPRGKDWVVLEEGVLRVSARLGDEPEHLQAVLERWYRREARLYLARRLKLWSERMGADYDKLSIRGQKTRWGSRSTSGTISLNWRLMLLPEAVADYVIIHELAHVDHMDHSPEFWARVAAFDPDCKAHRAQLKAFRPTI